MKPLIVVSATAAIAILASCRYNPEEDSVRAFGESLGCDFVHVLRIDSVKVAMPYIVTRRMGTLYLRGEFLRQEPDNKSRWRLRRASDPRSLLNWALGSGHASDSLRASITGHVGDTYYEFHNEDRAEIVFLEPNGKALVLVALAPTADPGGSDVSDSSGNRGAASED